MNMLPDRLKKLRETLGYSQSGIAQSVGMSQQTWDRWERETPKALDHLATLAKRYNVSADYLLGLSNQPWETKHNRLNEHRFEYETGDPEIDRDVRQLLLAFPQLPKQERQIILSLVNTLTPRIIGDAPE